MLRKMNELQMSALLEAGNIGSGHAAIALSQLMGRKIMIAIPAIDLHSANDIGMVFGDENADYVSVRLGVYGDVRGIMLMTMKLQMACSLCDIILGRANGSTAAVGEMEMSAIKEVTSILSGSYLNAISKMTEFSILMSTPNYDVGSALSITSILEKDECMSDELLCIKTEFLQMDIKVEGYMVFFPFDDAVDKMLEALGV